MTENTPSDALVERLRGAFDTDSVPEKNLAIRKAHDLIETQAREIERLRAALKLAANRLERNAVDYIAAGDPHAYEQSEWADEARRAALAGDSHDD